MCANEQSYTKQFIAKKLGSMLVDMQAVDDYKAALQGQLKRDYETISDAMNVIEQIALEYFDYDYSAAYKFRNLVYNVLVKQQADLILILESEVINNG